MTDQGQYRLERAVKGCEVNRRSLLVLLSCELNVDVEAVVEVKIDPLFVVSLDVLEQQFL